MDSYQQCQKSLYDLFDQQEIYIHGSKIQISQGKYILTQISSMVFEKWKQFRYVPATKVKTHSMMNRTAKDRLSTDIME